MNSALETLWQDIEAYRWVEKDWPHWLREFQHLLAQLAEAGQGGDESAMNRIAGYFGQLVTVPSQVRDEEETARKERRKALRRKARGDGWTYVPPVVGRSKCKDVKAINRFAIRLVKAYGVFNELKRAMNRINDPRRVGTDTLFVEEWWPKWRHWAAKFLFGKRRRRSRSKRRLRRRAEREMEQRSSSEVVI